MKLILVLVLCGVAAAASTVENPTPFEVNARALADEPSTHNILVNTLVRQLIAYLRHVINNGSPIFGIPPLDPINLDHYHLSIPAGLFNLELELNKVYGTGIGSFVVHRSNLDLSDLTFDLDISVPSIYASAELYDLIGDIYTAIPLYGKGSAVFRIDGFRFQTKLFLKQSDDEKSILIERIENTRYQIPSFKSEITGAIGGGDIDGIVNSIIEEVIVDYLNRFEGAVALAASSIAVPTLNSLLEELDTWKYIAVLLPNNRS